MNRSIKGRFTGGSAMPSLTFEMANYGKFLDEGVRGSKSNYIENRNSKNKFRNGKKSVPVGPIRTWCKKKGISEKLAFLIARSIYEKGIKHLTSLLSLYRRETRVCGVHTTRQ